MTTLWKIDEFIPATVDWTQYIERMNQLFIANEICEEPRKKAILLNSGSAEIYSLLRNLVAPAKPSDQILRKISQSYEWTSKSKAVSDYGKI